MIRQDGDAMMTGKNGWCDAVLITEAPDGLARMLHQKADQDKARLFALVDAARNNMAVAQLTAAGSEFHSLFTSEALMALAGVGPFLVPCRQDDPMMAWLTGDAWATGSVMFFTSQAPTDQLVRHLQHCFGAVTPDDRELFFRWYDPRIIRSYLPACKVLEAWRIMGPICRLMVESHDGARLLSFGREALGDSPSGDDVLWKQPIFISAAQMVCLRQDVARRFHQRMTAHLSVGFVDHIKARELDAVALERLVSDGIDRARMYGIRRDFDVQRYLEHMLVLDPDFDLTPGFEWASAILFTEGISGTEKMDRLDRSAALQLMADAAMATEIV